MDRVPGFHFDEGNNSSMYQREVRLGDTYRPLRNFHLRSKPMEPSSSLQSMENNHPGTGVRKRRHSLGEDLMSSLNCTPDWWMEAVYALEAVVQNMCSCTEVVVGMKRSKGTGSWWSIGLSGTETSRGNYWLLGYGLSVGSGSLGTKRIALWGSVAFRLSDNDELRKSPVGHFHELGGYKSVSLVRLDVGTQR